MIRAADHSDLARSNEYSGADGLGVTGRRPVAEGKA